MNSKTMTRCMKKISVLSTVTHSYIQCKNIKLKTYAIRGILELLIKIQKKQYFNIK